MAISAKDQEATRTLFESVVRIGERMQAEGKTPDAWMLGSKVASALECAEVTNHERAMALVMAIGRLLHAMPKDVSRTAAVTAMARLSLHAAGYFDEFAEMAAVNLADLEPAGSA